ncbi:MAG: flagellar hook-associated protein FlgK [Synergistaceae bacterium]|jgi:flagellar hook-associated protein 1 FlgK|nr:flagellar hook-associated protein FlgK [Synergistaceae bacterium]
MVSTYHGIETGRRALSYFRKGMEIASVNTFKADTEGYSRQVVNAAPTQGLEEKKSVSMLGTGVDVTSIERMRDLYLDARMTRAEISQAYWTTLNTGVKRVENFIVSASDKSLDNYLDDFWTAIQDVHKYADDEAVRSYFLREADNLTVFANSLSDSYNDYRDELNSDVRDMVLDANSYIDQIAILTKAIRSVLQAGAEANELLDKRDLLAEKLCVLTGAEASKPADELDGDYKINLNGKLLVQGGSVRHLILTENPTNRNYYDVQIEYNQYDITSDIDVAGVIIETRASMGGTCSKDGTHEMDVMRLADEIYWTVGHGLGQSEGGERIDGIQDPNASLSINGSFALQVGSAGVRAVSEVFSGNPPGYGIVLGVPGPGEQTEYTFRISAGEFEAAISLEWDSLASVWNVSDNLGGSSLSTGPDGSLSVDDLGSFMALNYSGYGIDVRYQNAALELESRDRHLMSIDDLGGDLMRSCGLANKNPAVKIDVQPEDSFQTIANKINNAYMFDRTYEVDEDGNEKPKGNLSYETDPPGTSPASPDQWLHASVETDGNGDCYLVLTSNVAGEAARINVLSGSVCGGGVTDMTLPRLLGLVDATRDAGGNTLQSDVTSYIQFRDDGTLVDRYDKYGDVYADDAWVIADGNEFISSTNEFRDARAVAAVGNAPADSEQEFIPGIRVDLNGVGHTTILVRHHLTEGAIFAALKLRDDVLLSQMDVFDDMTYKLASEFNAIHYAGYGGGEYSGITGMGFFDRIKSKYGSFGSLNVDPDINFDGDRLAVSTGDGSGNSLGAGDGTNALSIARLKQAKLFHNGIANFDDLYAGFTADLGSFGGMAKTAMDAAGYVVEQIGIQRESVMGVNADEEMLSLVEMNQGYNNMSQYISTLIGVMNQIISGLGRVGL